MLADLSGCSLKSISSFNKTEYAESFQLCRLFCTKMNILFFPLNALAHGKMQKAKKTLPWQLKALRYQHKY